MSPTCDKSTLNIDISERSDKTTALLKWNFDRHCNGKNNDGVNPGYVKKLFKTYTHVVIATAKNHMGTRSKSVKNLCGFLFLQKKQRAGRTNAYIDLVCSSDKIGWQLLDFAEDYVHKEWKVDGVYLHALDSVRCMYASRGYREVGVLSSCKKTVASEPKRISSTGTRMSKCVALGKKISTDKLYPPECDPKKNRQFYTTPHGRFLNTPKIPKEGLSKEGKMKQLQKMIQALTFSIKGAAAPKPKTKPKTKPTTKPKTK